jgi:CheY-like chemotaxis protein
MAAMPRSVLVVDDDLAFRELAGRTLRSWGHDVVGEAGTVAEALERAPMLRPDTVLVDIGLPDGDGFELAHRLIDQPWQPRVVLISTDSDVANHAAAERAGADGFVPKDEVLDAGLRSLLAAA